jgi:hypothetical protein
MVNSTCFSVELQKENKTAAITIVSIRIII